MSSVFLGIDTSNYKTSLAAADSEGKVLSEVSLLLDVPEGKRGLRQSEAFFMHSNRLPDMLKSIFSDIDPQDIEAIGVSDKPRRVEGSYMPCFLAGVNLAEELSTALKIPVYRFSHQEGHAAAVMPSGDVSSRIFMHLSGGTSEFLLCRPDQNGFDMHIAGGTKDISFGQLLDRFGVALGLPFPSGRYLDDIAYRYLYEPELTCDPEQSEVSLSVMPKIKLTDGYFNLSGAETRLMRFAESADVKDEAKLGSVCAEVFRAITDILIKAADTLSEQTDSGTVWMAGGVASSKTVRKLISESSSKAVICFGEPELSGDNAVGIARLAGRSYETGNCITGK